MVGCGIGVFGKRFGFRRARNRRNSSFDEIAAGRLDSDPCIFSSQLSKEKEQTAWLSEFREPYKDSYKLGYEFQKESPPKTVNPNDVYFGNTLGKGASGTVYRGQLMGEDVAIKIIRPDSEMTTEPLELCMGQVIGHPNLVKVLGVYINTRRDSEGDEEVLEDDGSMSDQSPLRRTSSSLFSDIAQDLSDIPREIWIVMEYCNKGSLREAIKKGEFFEDSGRRRPRVLHILFAALEVASAMEHLHSFGIIHGDLKSQNVMLAESQVLAKKFVCKVKGRARGASGRPVTSIKTHISTFTAGTVSHMPPEVLKDGILTPAVDVFSFGMLLWELISGELPFLGLNSGETMVSIVEGNRPEIPSFCPPMYVELIRRCWLPDRERRPDFKDVARMLKTMLGGPAISTIVEEKGIPALQIDTTNQTCTSDTLFSESETTLYGTTTDLSDNYLTVTQELPKKEKVQVEVPKSESMIPKPPRIATTANATDSVNAQKTARHRKRTKPFPQWQAYLDAINESNKKFDVSKTRIPTSSSCSPLFRSEKSS